MKRLLIAAALTVGMAVPAWTGAAGAAPPTSSFIVVLEPGGGDVPGAAAQLAASVRGDAGFVYQHSVQGFSITASDADARRRVGRCRRWRSRRGVRPTLPRFPWLFRRWASGVR